ncbi:MAG: tetratricopeptide repeat protein [Candidatus Latescibacterota bacterium]|nr:MAG: tetratricopeptide repeat protein [Candidatus Latescibacterota bacterium]
MFLRNLFRFIPRNALSRALGLFNRGEFEAAAVAFEALVRASEAPSSDIAIYACQAHLEAGKQRAAAGDVDEAIRMLERASSLRPGFADVLLLLGQLYERSDRTDSARRSYESALQINPSYFEARLCLARLLMHLGEGSEALRHLQEAHRSGPDFVADDLQELMAYAPTHTTAPESTRERLDSLFDTLLAGPASPLVAAVEIARRALRAGDSARAITEMKKLIRIHPDYPDLHNLLGVAYDNEEMTDDAVEEFELALALNPEYTDARLNLGMALFHRGHFEQAERHLRLVERQQPGHKLARALLDQIASWSEVS